MTPSSNCIPGEGSLYVVPPGKSLDRKYSQHTAKLGGKRIMFWGYIKIRAKKPRYCYRKFELGKIYGYFEKDF